MKDLIRGIDDPEHLYASRSEAVFAVLVAMTAAGCSISDMESVFLNPLFPIAAHVLEQGDSAKYLKRNIEKARLATIDRDVEKLNEKHALVLVGDKVAVLREGLDEDGKGKIELLGTTAFKEWDGNQFVKRKGKKIPLAVHWLRHPQRRQYEGLVFVPNREIPGYFNLWRGFAVKPHPGDCSRFLAHIRDNVCRGDEALYRWVVAWFAAIFQEPAKKYGTSLVIRGKMGTGKTVIGKHVGKLLGSAHYLPISDPRYIIGRFNSHIVSCVLLHADEGFFAGDHAAEAKLKDLITGDVQLIEFKNKDVVKVRNFVRLLVTGNADWIAPAGLEERRFAVIDIGEARMQDKAYFAAIETEMENGGYEALLHFFLKYDMTGIDLRTIPKTAALFEQKAASMTAEQGWWIDVLHSGKLPSGCETAGHCPTQSLFEAYITHANQRGVRRRSIQTTLGIFLKKVAPGLRKREGTYRFGGDRQATGMIYEFPGLATCREHFEKMLQQEIDWSGPNEWVVESSSDDCFEPL